MSAKPVPPPRAAEAEAESDAEVATRPRAETALADGNASMSFDEDGPVWPNDAAETAFLGEEKNQGRVVPPASLEAVQRAEDHGAEAKTPLPALDSLIARIPAVTRETLEDLFRVKFTGVRRVSKELLK